MNRSVVVAKIQPAAEHEVAAIWAESDQTELPRIAGITHRSLYRLGDLYVHLLETVQPGADAVRTAMGHAEFAKVSTKLSQYVTPYLPTWKSPPDAQAHCFYEWRGDPRSRSCDG